ncbi:hypothetical protein GYA19_02225 [Candidatus Beckwithbacteria bacterium]|nr:hypothetical protein [Candidatus Beckwithbacteria bacterium]
MLKNSTDPYQIMWIKYLDKPNMAFYLLFKMPIVLGITIIAFAPTYFFVDKIFAYWLAFCFFTSFLIFFIILSYSDYEKKIVYELKEKELIIDKEKFTLKELNKQELLTKIKPLATRREEWFNEMKEKSDIALSPKINLQFPNEEVRQKVIKSLIYYFEL